MVLKSESAACRDWMNTNKSRNTKIYNVRETVISTWTGHLWPIPIHLIVCHTIIQQDIITHSICPVSQLVRIGLLARKLLLEHNERLKREICKTNKHFSFSCQSLPLTQTHTWAVTALTNVTEWKSESAIETHQHHNALEMFKWPAQIGGKESIPCTSKQKKSWITEQKKSLH